MNLRCLLIAVSMVYTSLAYAATIKSSAPQVYTVQPGDTLWKISGQYTDNPWEWKSIWSRNQKINNPNRIYPGDELHVVNGQLIYKRKYNPTAIRKRSGGLRTVKLSPEMREMPLETGIPAISYSKIKNTLIDAEIMLSKDIKNLPYIVAFESKVITGQTAKRVYVKGDVTIGKTYNVYRLEQMHKASEPNEVKKGRKRTVEIGSELIKTGEIIIDRKNEDVYAGVIKSLDYVGVREGQYLLPQDDVGGIPNLYLDPKPAPQGTEATIVSVPNKFINAGKSNTVIIDRGLDAGLEPGDILLAQTDEYFTDDPLNPKKRIKIPGESAGIIMLYKTFDRMSLGVVVEATKSIKVGYKVAAPYNAL